MVKGNTLTAATKEAAANTRKPRRGVGEEERRKTTRVMTTSTTGMHSCTSRVYLSLFQ
jgi:hypothetical protein